MAIQQSDQNQSDQNRSDQNRKIRYAVVGLGWFAQAAALPAFAQADNSQLVALISDDPEKLQELGEKYGIEQRYSYSEYDYCLSSGEIDAVYIALPNHLHADFTVRAAQAGVHVLCEKPMAVTPAECERMISACEAAQVKLMVAYRLHLEAANMQAVETVQSGKLGEPRIFNSVFTQQTEGSNIRMRQETGGGTLEDIGIYCINAARYLFQAEPIQVFAVAANNGEERFAQVDEMTSVIMRFPEQRLANFTVSFGAAKTSSYQVLGTKGDLRVSPAYTWQGAITHDLTLDGEEQQQTFEARDQLAAEFIYFSDCILQNRQPEPSGQEGLIDVKIIQALHKSIESGQPVDLQIEPRGQRPDADQTIQRPATSAEPELVNAAEPSGKTN